VSHQLQGATQVYGTFALVIGLLAWFFLGAQLTMYAAELNVVLRKRLWPRSLVHPPFTDADERALKRLAKVEERYEEETVEATLDQGPGEPGTTEKSDRWKAAG
jgi:hypothetical protein